MEPVDRGSVNRGQRLRMERRRVLVQVATGLVERGGLGALLLMLQVGCDKLADPHGLPVGLSS